MQSKLEERKENQELTSEGYRELTSIVGKAGKGKTILLRSMLRKSKRALVYDPLAVMSPGLICYRREEIERFLDSDRQDFRIVYRPRDQLGNPIKEFEIKLLQAEMDWLAGVAIEVGGLDLMVDEIDSFGEWSDEKMSKSVPRLFGLVNFGRRRNVSVHGTVRRPQVKIPRDWVTETTIWKVFQLTDEYDIASIQRKFPVETEQIKSLQIFEYLEYDANTSQIRKKSIKLDQSL